MNMMNMKKKAVGMVMAAMMMTGASAFAATPQTFTLSENGDYEAALVEMVPQTSSGASQVSHFYSDNADYEAVSAEAAPMTSGSHTSHFYSDNADYEAVVNR